MIRNEITAALIAVTVAVTYAPDVQARTTASPMASLTQAEAFFHAKETSFLKASEIASVVGPIRAVGKDIS